MKTKIISLESGADMAVYNSQKQELNTDKMVELQQNMQTLLLISYSYMVKTKNTNSSAVTGRNKEPDTRYVHNSITPTDRHRSSVDTIKPQQHESH